MLRLKSERLKRGMTITELAFSTRIHPATLGKLEGKKMVPYAPHKAKLESYFAIPAKELFMEVEPDDVHGK